MILAPDGMLWSSPVWVDFAHVDQTGWLRLDFPGTVRDLAAGGITLASRMMLVLYQDDLDADDRADDLVAVAKVIFEEEKNRWMAADWTPILHLSDLGDDARRRYDEGLTRLKLADT